MKRMILFTACGLMACAGVFAQQDEPKLIVKPSGRILMDAGVMHSTDDALDDKLNDGVAIPDVRAGLSATYGKWKAKVDVGYARQSLSLNRLQLRQGKPGSHGLLRSSIRPSERHILQFQDFNGRTVGKSGVLQQPPARCHVCPRW